MTGTQQTPLALVVLISGNGSNLQAIIDACASGRINATIRAVISNNPDAFGLQRAQQAGIASHVIDHRRFADRQSFDRAMSALIDEYAPGLVVLAGFMRILSNEFVNHYLGRMLNVHPSLLPDFRGLNTHQRVIEAGIGTHGASIHFVTPELDGGPVVGRSTLAVQADDTPASLAKKVFQLEHQLYPEVIGWFADGRLQLQGNQAILDGKPVPQLEKTIDEN